MPIGSRRWSFFALFVALFGWHPEARLRHRALTSAVGLAVIVLPIVAVVLDGANSGVDWIAPLDVAELRASDRAVHRNHVARARRLLVAIPLAVGLVSVLERWTKAPCAPDRPHVVRAPSRADRS